MTIKKETRLLCSISLICLLLVVVAGAQERAIQLPPIWPTDGRIPERLKNQYVFLNPQQDTLIVKLLEDWNNLNGPYRMVRVALHNRLQPSVQVTLSSPKPGRYQYTYTVSNSLKAKDRIGTWALVVPLEDEDFAMSHEGTSKHQGWSGKQRTKVLNAPRVGLPGWPLGCYARWFRDETSELITPGNKISGFEISSANKPGLTTAFFASDIPPPFELLQGAPAVFDGQMEFYNKDPAWRDRPLVTIGPRFPANTPEIEILRNFRAGIEQLLKDKKLEAGSLFTKELLKTLVEVTGKNSPHSFVITAKPLTSFEAEIKAALETSLSKK